MNRLVTTLRWYSMSFPPDLDNGTVLSVVRGWSTRARQGWFGSVAPLVVEIERSGGHYRWRFGVDQRDSQTLLRELRHTIPALRVEPTERSLPKLDRGVELRLRSPQRAINTGLDGQPSTALLLAMSSIGDDEVAVVQWVIGPWMARRPVPPPRETRDPGWPWRLLQTDLDLDSEQTQALRAKQREHLFGVVGRLAVGAASRSRGQQILNNLFGSLQLVREPGVGFVRRLVRPGRVPSRIRDVQAPSFEWPCVLNTAEIAAVLGWPVDGPNMPGVVYEQSRPLPAADETLVPEPVIQTLESTRLAGRFRPVASAICPGQSGLLVLRPKDALQHLHVLGPTGSGKSHLLANLVLADIAAGRGAVVIEPKGDLVEAIADRIPEPHRDRVVILNAADLVALVGLNPLATATGERRELVVVQLLSTIHGLWADSWGPRTNDLLHAGLTTLAGQPGASLIGLAQLFTNDSYRRPLVDAALSRDPWGLASFWSWYEQLSAEQRAQVLAPVMNKLRSFMLRPSLRAILGQTEPRFDLRQVFTEHRVLLVNLAVGAIGAEASALLGSILVAQLWQLTTERSQLPAERRHPVMVSIDEFQDYLHLPTSISEVLAQARGLGVGLTLARQHLGQLTADVREAVLANARSRVVFRLAHRDARVIADGHPELTAEDIAGLDRYAVYASLMTNGSPQPFASGVTRDLPRTLGSSAVIRAATRTRWGVPADETDRILRDHLDGPASTPDNGDEFGVRRRTS